MGNDKSIGIAKIIASIFNGKIGVTKATDSNVIKDDKPNVVREKDDISIQKSSSEILKQDNITPEMFNISETKDIMQESIYDNGHYSDAVSYTHLPFLKLLWLLTKKLRKSLHSKKM